jgi:hypothetical protein
MTRFRPLGLFAGCVLILVLAWGAWSETLRATIVIEAGPKGGFFDQTANLLRAELGRRGIRSEIVNREDTLKILDDVDDPASRVQVGFMAQDPGNRDFDQATAVGTVALEPLFVFYSASLGIRTLHDFRGLRLAVSPSGSGTRVIAEQVLGLYGIDPHNATFLPLTLNDSADALRRGEADAAFFLQPPGNKIVRELALDPKLRMLSLGQADALASNLGFVRAATVHQGGFDYLRNIPSDDIRVIAIPVTLLIKKDVKPAIVTMAAQFVQTHFQGATLVSGPGELLSIREPSVPVNIHAEPVLKNGLPYIYRSMPFPLAALLDQFSLYIGVIIFAGSIYSSMNFPRPGVIWREIQLKWYVRKLERLSTRVMDERKEVEPADRLVMEKVRALMDKEEARLRRIPKILAELETKASERESTRNKP